MNQLQNQVKEQLGKIAEINATIYIVEGEKFARNSEEKKSIDSVI